MNDDNLLEYYSIGTKYFIYQPIMQNIIGYGLFISLYIKN